MSSSLEEGVSVIQAASLCLKPEFDYKIEIHISINSKIRAFFRKK